MNQEKLVQDFLHSYTADWLKEDLLAMEQEFPAKQEPITASLAAAIAQLCREVRLQQEAGCKAPTAYLCISFLRTNILQDNWQYRLDLYDETLFLDQMPCFASWNMDFVWAYLRNRLTGLAVAVNTGIYANKSRAYHIDTLKLAMAEQYHRAAVDFTQRIIRDALQTPEYAAMTKAPSLKVLMGEYQDRVILLYEEQPTEEKNECHTSA